MRKLLIVTDSPALPTGMAETTRLLFAALKRRYPLAYDLFQIGLFHTYAIARPEWPVYTTDTLIGPSGRRQLDPEDVYSTKSFARILAELRPDLVYAFNDPQRVAHICVDPSQRSYGLAVQVNVDGWPLPLRREHYLINADALLTSSIFSSRALLACNPNLTEKSIDYLYSPSDLSRFSPASEERKVNLRAEHFPDWIDRSAFVLGWVGRNQWRKQVWILYRVIEHLRVGGYRLCARCGNVLPIDDATILPESIISDHVPERVGLNSAIEHCSRCGFHASVLAKPIDDIFLWLHMPPDEPGSTWPIELLAGSRKCRSRMFHYTAGCGHLAALSPEDVATLFQLWDGLLYLSGGEGFGLPAWEAMATGLPVVYTNYSSHGEFLSAAGAGIPVGGTLQPEANTCILRIVANISQAVGAVRRLYYDRKLALSLGGAGRRYVEQFSPDAQAQKLHGILSRIC